VLQKLRIAIERWSAAPAGQVIARWREVSDTIGKKVRVELPGQVIEGVAQDIDANGNLVVDGLRVSAGSVTVLGG
jgi:BirA family biotin operon repressor/biotin-[acetyl-CoA-carboxylase] ligase